MTLQEHNTLVSHHQLELRAAGLHALAAWVNVRDADQLLCHACTVVSGLAGQEGRAGEQHGLCWHASDAGAERQGTDLLLGCDSLHFLGSGQVDLTWKNQQVIGTVFMHLILLLVICRASVGEI